MVVACGWCRCLGGYGCCWCYKWQDEGRTKREGVVKGAGLCGSRFDEEGWDLGEAKGIRCGSNQSLVLGILSGHVNVIRMYKWLILKF